MDQVVVIYIREPQIRIPAIPNLYVGRQVACFPLFFIVFLFSLLFFFISLFGIFLGERGLFWEVAIQADKVKER